MVAPQTTTRPAGRTAASVRAQVASPTVSTTTSTPLPVASFTAATTSPSWWFTATSAPQSRAVASFSSLPDVTIVRRPSARQISNAAVATPPPMPQISAHSPSRTASAGDEHPVRGLVDERERRRDLERERVVEREHLRRVDRDQLGVRAVAVLADDRDRVAVLEPRVEHDPLADREPADALAERLDDAGAVGAEDARLRHGRQALAHPDVEVVERGGVQPDERPRPGPATGSGTSSTRSTSGPPSSWIRAASMARSSHAAVTRRAARSLPRSSGSTSSGAAPAAPYEDTERHIHERRARGLFGSMRFTMARPEVSCHPETLLEGARTVVSAALCYYAPRPGARRGGGPAAPIRVA